MGVHENIGIDTFPKQGTNLGKACEVCFRFDPSDRLRGVFVRNDTEEPYRTIIRLEDGRHVLTTECQWTWPAFQPLHERN